MSRTIALHRGRCRTGFTLLELILALSLAVVLTVLIGQAMSFYVVQLETRDLEVRRVQLATSVMKMISDDLKATLSIAEFDDATLAAALSSAGLPGQESDQGGEPSSMLFDVEEEPLDEEDTLLDMETVDLALGTTALQRPGLIGNQYQVMFDISRPPRLEEFQTLMAPPSEGLVDVPSDIKTVTYFVQPAGTTGVLDPLAEIATGTEPLAVQNNNGGLVRRQLDRQATLYALESGNTATLNRTGDLLAPEVLGIEFSYWDGFMWQMQWNSDEMQALPLAIQIRLTIGPPGQVADRAATAPPAAATSAAAAGDPGGVRVFQQVVRIPMGRILEESELAEDDLSGVGL